jgi:hypothetical protein
MQRKHTARTPATPQQQPHHQHHHQQQQKEFVPSATGISRSNTFSNSNSSTSASTRFHSTMRMSPQITKRVKDNQASPSQSPIVVRRMGQAHVGQLTIQTNTTQQFLSHTVLDGRNREYLVAASFGHLLFRVLDCMVFFFSCDSQKPIVPFFEYQLREIFLLLMCVLLSLHQ